MDGRDGAVPMSTKGKIIGDEPCPSCRSKGRDKTGNHRIIFDNGNKYCSRCKITWRADKPKEVSMVTIEDVSKLDSGEIRGVSEETAKLYGVKVGYSQETGEVASHFYPYYKDGKVVGYKKRDAINKGFIGVGTTKGAGMFGQNICPEGGRLLIVTEGELDALSAYELLKDAGKAYSVVSLPSGANAKGFRDNFMYLESFETVIINFDSDEQGKKAAKECAEVLSPERCKILSLPEGYKDANEMLQAGASGKDYLRAIYKASTYRPDGIINLADAWDRLFEDDDNPSVPYPWEGLNEKTYGLRKKELVTITAGSGVGKSAIIRELEHHLLKTTNYKLGLLALEESVGRTEWGIMAIEANKPYAIREERAGITEEEIKKLFDSTVGTGRVFCYDHFGSTGEDNLINKIKYMIKALECDIVILDHLSIVVSAMEGDDERRVIDRLMTILRTIVEETKVGMIIVTHLRRPTGQNKGHENGAEVTLSQLRGSHSIAQLSDMVIGAERNQQADTEEEANTTRLRVLKNRYAGLTGLASHLYYDRETGRLTEIDEPEDTSNL